jgi:hypothetical protein
MLCLPRLFIFFYRKEKYLRKENVLRIAGCIVMWNIFPRKNFNRIRNIVEVDQFLAKT